MKKFAKRTIASRRAGAAFALAALHGAAMVLPAAAMAQVAGGSEAGIGPPQWLNGALYGGPGPTEPTRCIHRSIDLRRGSSLDDNRLVVWLSVHQPATVLINASGSASGADTGTFAIALMRDGIPVANSAESRGSDFISANASAAVRLVPGQQYKLTAKATVTNKRLDLFDMKVGVGKPCP